MVNLLRHGIVKGAGFYIWFSFKPKLKSGALKKDARV